MVKEISGTSSASGLQALGNEVPMKLENEKWSKLQARVKVAKNGKGFAVFLILH